MEINRENLIEGLKKAKVFIGKSSENLPILTKVHFNAEKQALEATNLETFIKIPMKMTKCKRKSKGEDIFTSFCGDPGDIIKILKLESGDKVTIDLKKMKSEGDMFSLYQITLGENFETLHVLPSDEFPTIDTPPEKDTKKVADLTKAQILKVNNIKTTEDNFRHDIVHISPNSEMVKTDGHRLHLLKIQSSGESINIPADALTKIGKILQKDESAELSVSGIYGVFEIGVIDVIVRLSDINYPDYKGVFLENAHSVVVNREALLTAATQASIMDVSALMTFNGKLEIRCSNPEKGEYANNDIPFQGEGVGEEILMGINPEYIRDVLTSCSADEVTIELIDESKPLVFTETDFTGLVMPVRV